jgi:hypothetical protein
VLKAAAKAAAPPTGTIALTISLLRPRRRAITDARPAPICTAGPSRPSAIPLAREVEQQKNLPTTVRNEIRPSRMKTAVLVCGTPLPRAKGK